MKQEPKLDQAFLNNMYISATHYMRDTSKDRHEMDSAFIARVWLEAFKRTLHAHGLTIEIKPKEN